MSKYMSLAITFHQSSPNQKQRTVFTWLSLLFYILQKVTFSGPKISVASVATTSEIHATAMLLLLNVMGNGSDFKICKS